MPRTVSNPPAWIAKATKGAQSCCLRIQDADGYLSFKTVFELLFSTQSFRAWYTGQLVCCEHKAIYWEHPPLTGQSASRPYEVAIIDAPALAGTRADDRPFAAPFSANLGRAVTAFRNLGGDASLIVPMPRSQNADYSHLLSFLRTADADQVGALWQLAASSLLKDLSQSPIWLSTAGGGVNWLHLRIDTRPKYYQHPGYRGMA